MLNHFDGIISHCSIKVTPDREVSNTSSASGQDEPNRAMWLATRAGKVEPSCSLGTTRCIPQETLPRKPYNKSFIDHVCSVKMAKYWPRSFFASLWTSTSSRSINTQKIGFIIWLSGKLFMLDTAGSSEWARWLHPARPGSQSHRAIWFILHTRRASHIISLDITAFRPNTWQ